MKTCSKCQCSKPLDAFGRDKNKADGLNRNCKNCCRESTERYRAANLEKTRAYSRERAQVRRATAEGRMARQTAAQRYRQAHPEKTRAATQLYREQFPAKSQEASRQWRVKNPEKMRALSKAWQQKNSDVVSAYEARRRAAKLKATPAWADPAAIATEYALAKWCTEVMGAEFHVDHIVPLKSKIVCGLHCEANLQVIPGQQNISKGNHHWPGMP